MLEFLFLFLFLFTPIITFFMLRAAGEELNRISLVSVTVLSLYVFSVIGLLPLFYHMDEYRVAMGVTDQEVVLSVLLNSSVNLAFFMVGVLFIRKGLRLKPVSINPDQIADINKLQRLALYFSLCVFVFVLGVYLQKVGGVALFSALSGGVGEAKQARSSMGNDFSGSYHWFKLIMIDLGNLLTFTFFGVWLLNKKVIAFMIFALSLCISTFVAVMATEKGPFVWLVIGLFMVYFLIRSGGLVPYKNASYLVVTISACLVGFYMLFMGVEDANSALASVVSRAFSGGIAPAYFYLQYFPEYQEFLYGRTFPNPGGIMPYEPYSYTREIMNWVVPSNIEKGIVGTMPTVFWGEAYANFGFLGIPFVAFFVGILVSLISYVVSKFELTPLMIGYLVWVILFYKNLGSTGFSSFLYSIYFIFISIFFIAVVGLKGRVIIRNNSSFSHE